MTKKEQAAALRKQIEYLKLTEGAKLFNLTERYRENSKRAIAFRKKIDRLETEIEKLEGGK
jgi:hypothetical protein